MNGTKDADSTNNTQGESHQQAKADLAKDEAQGAKVHKLDRDATPEQKAAEARKGAPDLSSSGPVGPGPTSGGTAVVSDVGNKAKVAPTTNLSELAKTQEEEHKSNEPLKPEEAALKAQKDEGRIDDDGTPSPPGAMPAKNTVREIPSWFAIGWNGQDKQIFLTPDEARQRSLLSEFIDEAYYGQWFHNAGIVVFAVVAAHFVTRFRIGWAGLIIILAFCTTYYTTSINRTQTRVRDDMAREVAKKGLKADVESATWLNLFMTRFWLIYEPVLSATIIASVDQVLSISCPSFLDSIRMTTFTLGTKPPHIDHVRTFADTADDIVMMEWKISFVPNDILDMTKRMADKKINPKVVISVGVGIGPAVVHKDIIVEDIMFQGTMRIKMKLMNNFPHVQTVDLSFMQPPVFDFSLNPVGFDLSIIPGLKPFIFSQVHANLGPMMYAPNTFTLNLEQMLSGAPIDTAVGVLALTIHSGKGLKGVKLGGGTPDPYVAVNIAGRDPLAKTTVKKSTTSPNWGPKETKFILLNNLTEVMNLVAFDWNEHRPDNTLGSATLDLKSLAEDGQQEGKLLEIIHNGSPRGQLKIDAVFSPVLTAKKLPDGTVEPIPETSTGVVRLTIHQAKDLDPRGEQINPYFKALLNNQVVHKSQVLKRTVNPIWERSTEFLVTDKKNAVIGLQVFDENGVRGDGKVGSVQVKLQDIFDAKAKEIDWFPLAGARSGRVRLSAEWKPVAMAGAISGAAAYSAPIGTLRIYFKRAVDVKNVEAITGGKSDPYARVLSSGIVVARTEIHNNNLNPEFDEIVYATVHSNRDTFTVELNDYQEHTRDRSLGLCEFKVADLIKEGPDKKTKPWESTGKKSFKEALATNGGRNKKGSVEFDVEFFPCAHLKDVGFTPPAESDLKEEDENKPEPTAEEKEAKKALEESEGIVIPRDELLKAQSGILAVQVITGNLAKKGARLEILFDDGYWPTYSTEASRSTHAVWDEIGEHFVKELDFSQVILKLNTAEKETNEDIVGQLTVDANDFLEKCLGKPFTFNLTTPSGNNRSSVTLQCCYVPVEIELLPRESINNTGNLRVDLVDAKNVPSADRSGKSDPYAVFELAGKKVFKSEIVKKTLNPTWNQFFEVPIPSREGANFTVEVFDWDRVGTATRLCKGVINLADLEPIEQKEVVIVCQAKDGKEGKEPCTVNLKLLFRPAFLARTRGATSTFSAGRIGTGLGAVGGGVIGAGGTVLGAGAHGVGAVGKGVGSVGKGVFGGVTHLVKGGHSGSGKKDFNQDQHPPSIDEEGIWKAPTPESPAQGGANGTSTPPKTGAPGVITATVSKVSDLDNSEDKCYVVLKHQGKAIGHTKSDKGDRTHAGNPITFDESFRLKPEHGSGPEEPFALEVAVLHHKLIGSDPVIGTAAIDNVHSIVGPMLSPSSTITLPLIGGNGKVELTLSWTAAGGFLDSPATRSGAQTSDARSVNGSVSPSTKSKSKFSRLSIHRSPKHEQE